MEKDYLIKFEYVIARINNIIDDCPKLVAHSDYMSNSQESPYYLRYESDNGSLWIGMNIFSTNDSYLLHRSPSMFLKNIRKIFDIVLDGYEYELYELDAVYDGLLKYSDSDLKLWVKLS